MDMCVRDRFNKLLLLLSLNRSYMKYLLCILSHEDYSKNVLVETDTLWDQPTADLALGIKFTFHMPFTNVLYAVASYLYFSFPFDS